MPDWIKKIVDAHTTPKRRTGKFKNSDDIPDGFRPYIFHGLVMNGTEDQGLAECIVCNREKFYVSPEKGGLWECKVCCAKGNIYKWLKILWESSQAQTGDIAYQLLAAQKKILDWRIIKRWGLVKSMLSDEWLLPGFNVEGAQTNLYRYVRITDLSRDRSKDGHGENGNGNGGGKQTRQAFLATPGLNHGFYCDLDTIKNLPDKKRIIFTEGPWDGMALEETATRSKQDPTTGGYVFTPSAETSAFADTAVIASPGANVFLESWGRICAAKTVLLLYDNDHPHVHPTTGKTIEGAGQAGIKRAISILSNASDPCESIQYLRWGTDEQYDTARKSGYDLRDFFIDAGAKVRERIPALALLFSAIRTVPEEWIQGAKAGRAGQTVLEPLRCRSWKELTNQWRKAAKWTKGLEGALANMLACAVSTMLVGEQLWLICTAPPSSGKSMLCEALSVARKHVFPKDTFSGLFSGYQVDAEGTENLSVVLKINGKTLAIKDADTLLQHPNKAQILSQFRALYDRAVRTQYNNKMSLDHDNINTTVILCGTPSLRVLDDSELGQRFVSYRIMSSVDEKLENDINESALNHFFDQITTSPLINGEGADSPERIKAKRMTGGYLEYICETAPQWMVNIKPTREMVDLCNNCGKFVAYFRARPSLRQQEEVQRELSTRLSLQMAKMLCCLSVVYGKEDTSAATTMVKQIARDTAYGRTLNIAHYLYSLPVDVDGECIGAETKAVALILRETEDKTRNLLHFLQKINVVDKFEYTNHLGSRRYRWRLAPYVSDLYAKIMEAPAPLQEEQDQVINL